MFSELIDFDSKLFNFSGSIGLLSKHKLCDYFMSKTCESFITKSIVDVMRGIVAMIQIAFAIAFMIPPGCTLNS